MDAKGDHMMKVERIDEHKIRVTKTATVPAEVVTLYEYGWLMAHRTAIEAQKAEQIAARDAELAEIDAMLAEAAKLGVTALPAEPETPTPAPAPANGAKRRK